MPQMLLNTAESSVVVPFACKQMTFVMKACSTVIVVPIAPLMRFACIMRLMILLAYSGMVVFQTSVRLMLVMAFTTANITTVRFIPSHLAVS